VTVRLITYTDDYYGMSQRDVELALQISAAARRLGLSADPSAVQSVLVIPGATSPAEVMRFWRAALGFEPRRDSPAEHPVDPQILLGLGRSGLTFRRETDIEST
jgi:4a-hydroxytetrahydrobiopterin dehydratase